MMLHTAGLFSVTLLGNMIHLNTLHGCFKVQGGQEPILVYLSRKSRMIEVIKYFRHVICG
jgi:hypothetical protein